MPAKYSYDIALTVTLPSKAKRYDAETQHKMYTDKLKMLLINCRHSTVIELTKNDDIHYHSILRIKLDSCAGKHPLRYIKDIFRYEFGYTVVKEVTEYDVWREYLLKDMHNTVKVLYPIVKDDYNIFMKKECPWPDFISEDENE